MLFHAKVVMYTWKDVRSLEVGKIDCSFPKNVFAATVLVHSRAHIQAAFWPRCDILYLPIRRAAANVLLEHKNAMTLVCPSRQCTLC